uniref:Uncharacterized protein n=1 Tax=Loa loa TaxID=7209 RepID=A0A1I7VLV3_LOALO
MWASATFGSELCDTEGRDEARMRRYDYNKTNAEIKPFERLTGKKILERSGKCHCCPNDRSERASVCRLVFLPASAVFIR